MWLHAGGQTAMPKTPLKSTVDSDGNTTDFRRRQGEKPQHRRTDKMTNAGREAVQNTDAQFQPNRKLNWTRNRHPCSGLCGARQPGSGVFTGDRSVPDHRSPSEPTCYGMDLAGRQLDSVSNLSLLPHRNRNARPRCVPVVRARASRLTLSCNL